MEKSHALDERAVERAILEAIMTATLGRGVSTCANGIASAILKIDSEIGVGQGHGLTAQVIQILTSRQHSEAP